MIINKPYTNKEYADLAVYCNRNDCHIEDKGAYLESVQNEHHESTYDEVKEIRARLYQRFVDPITSHIQRLRDKEQTEEIVTKINELIAERDIKVQEIIDKYPYPVEEL